MRNPFGALSLAVAATFAVTLSGGCTEADRARPEVPRLVATVASNAITTDRASNEPARSVVLVAIDGVRYQEVFLGVDPELAERYHVPAEERLVPRWHPNQLRHNFATRARREVGEATTQVLLGHSKLDTTLIYAEADREKAAQAARLIG